MSMIYILFSAMLCANAESAQSLVYDLSVDNAVVGERRVDVTYLPSSKSNPLGMRRIELWTTLKTTVQGAAVSYTQRCTAQLSEQKASFVISTQLNDQVTELQGKRFKDGSWLVHQISDTDVKKIELRKTQVSAVSLELFDPGRAELWQAQDSYQLLVLEGLEPFIVQGAWSEKDMVLTDESLQAIAAKQLQGKSKEGILNAVWSADGMLIDWDIAIMGITLHADIRSVPKPPNFGELVAHRFRRRLKC